MVWLFFDIFDSRFRFATSSFYFIDKWLENGLDTLGIPYEVKDIFTSPKKSEEDVVSIFHPFHYRGKFDFDKKSILYGLADTDEFSFVLINKLKQMDYGAFVVPSNFVNKVFGLPKTIILKHPLNPVLKKFKVEKKDRDVPIFFINASHSWHRRGTDLAIDALDRASKDGYEFKAVVHSWLASDIDVKRDWLDVVGGFQGDELYYKMFGDADFFLHPARGGAFEITIAEALALGVTPIIPNVEPFNEVPLSANDVYYVDGGQKVYAWHNQWHTGKMWEVSLDALVEVVEKALDSGKKQIDTKKYLDAYDNVKYAENVVKIAEGL